MKGRSEEHVLKRRGTIPSTGHRVRAEVRHICLINRYHVQDSLINSIPWLDTKELSQLDGGSALCANIYFQVFIQLRLWSEVCRTRPDNRSPRNHPKLLKIYLTYMGFQISGKSGLSELVSSKSLRRTLVTKIELNLRLFDEKSRPSRGGVARPSTKH